MSGKVTAVTHRKDPIMQTCIGPSEEHVSMAGIPTEASIYGMVEKAMPGIRDHGIACKTIFDCTVPYDQKERFKRARFMEVDPTHWVK